MRLLVYSLGHGSSFQETLSLAPLLNSQSGQLGWVYLTAWMCIESLPDVEVMWQNGVYIYIYIYII